MKLILLVEDDERLRTAFADALRERGYRVIESDNGIKALELARQQMPDLILTDINMPGGGGQALLHHIRTDPELSSRQVVLMTGRTDMVSPRRGMEQGADDFLAKPVTRSALLSCVEARLKRSDIHWRVEDRVLSELSSSMTSALPHEFFTPLAGIIGLAEILHADASTLSSEELRDFHRDIHQSALRLHRTLRNYLLILELQSEPEAHRPPAEPLSPANVRKCLESAVDAIVDRHHRREDVVLHLEECPVLAAAADLTLMVEEILDNAFKFSRAGTPVTIQMDAKGVLLVTDSGRGMTTEEIEQIGAFRQFDRKKHEQQGLGLGLILVQKLANRHRASFLIQKRPETGIQIRIAFRTQA